MKTSLRTKILGFISAIAFVTGLCAPASATITPTITIYENQVVGGSPGAPRRVVGTIQFSAADTYVTGGLVLTPQLLGLSSSIQFINLSSPSGAYDAVVAPIAGTGNQTLKLVTPGIFGASNVAATATTATVTIPVTSPTGSLSANSQIYCALDDAATAGGGTGTWAVTDAVSSCKFASATTFTITVIAAAPTNNGNFIYAIFGQGIGTEMAAGTNVASILIPFIAYGN